jgi:hypothetical protein
MNDLLAVTAHVVGVARRTLPSDILKQSGRVLYTPADTLISRSPVYFLGANPGVAPGSRQPHALLTVEEDLQRLEKNAIREHAYLDETWKGSPFKGQSPIQRRAQKVFRLLAGDNRERGIELLRQTPVSNLAFTRSQGISELDYQIAEWCWPFHQAVIEKARPAVVITHAVTIARRLTNQWGLGNGERRPSGWGGSLQWCYAWTLPSGPKFLAIPNLSRYSPDGERETPLRAFFNEFAPAC